MNDTTVLDPVATDFVERMGVALEGFGLSRIGGRILAYLVYKGEPSSFDDLTEALRISRGSVSTNTRQLEQLGVIRRVSRPGERVDFFRIAPDAQARFLEAWVARLDGVAEIFRDALDELPEEQQGARKRIRRAVQVYRSIVTAFEQGIHRWDEVAERRRPSRSVE